MSSVPESRFTIPNGPASSSSIFSSIWELFFGSSKKSTTDSSESSRPTETRMIKAKKCKPRIRTRPSHGWECSDDGKDTKKAMIYCPYSKPKPSDERPSRPVEKPPRLPVGISRPLPDPSEIPPATAPPEWAKFQPYSSNGGQAPSTMDQHEVPIQRGPRRRNVGFRQPRLRPAPWERDPTKIYDPQDDELIRDPWGFRDGENSGYVKMWEKVGDCVVRVARAAKDVVVRIITHPKMPHVVGAMAVVAACYYAYKWWCPETAVPVEN